MALEERRHYLPRQFPAGKRRVTAHGCHLRRVHGPARSRVHEYDVGRLPGLERAALVLDPADGGRHRGGHAGKILPAHQAGFDHGVLDHGERGFQPGHAHGCLRPLAFLVFARVRGVVGADDVDRAVGQGGPEGLDIGVRAQRRVDLVDGVVAAGELIREPEVVRGDLGRDVDAAGLGPADNLHGPGRGDVADVQAGPDVLGQQHVPGDDALFGDGRPAGQAEDGGDLALVHLGAGSEPGFLRVLGHDAVERLDVFERAAHQHRIVDADAVVGEHPHVGAGVGHGAELGELLPREADGDCSHRADVHPAGGPAKGEDLLHDAGGVRHRGAVGHGVHGRVAAQGGGAGAGFDGFGVFAARFAQVGVDVHHARERDEARGVDYCCVPHPGAVGVQLTAAGGDHAVPDQEVLGGSAQDRGAPDEVGAAVVCVLVLIGHQWLSWWE